MPKYTQKDLWDLYKTLPEELKRAIFSAETAETLQKIYERHEIKDEIAEKISELITFVFLGLLSPKEFRDALIQEVKINIETARILEKEIYRYIFFPVKPSLEQLYGEGATPSFGMPFAEKPKEKPKEDIYREPIE